MSSTITTGRVVVMAAILCTSAAAQPPNKGAATPPSGQAGQARTVLQQKPGFALWNAERRIDPRTIGIVYEVEQADGVRLLLKAPGRGLRGWSQSSEVIALDLAEDFFSQSVVINPNDPFGYLMRGIARLEKGNTDGALADLDEALKHDPKYVPGLVRRAAMLRARQLPDRALADLEQAIAIDGRDSSAYVERALLWFARNDLAKTMKDLDRATALGSPDVLVDIVRGQVFLEKRETRKAYDAFAHVLKVDPTRHDAYLGLASVYLMRGQPRNGQAVLDDAVRSDPNNPEAYGNRATFHLARGDYEKALSNLDKVIRLSPGSARAHNERAWLLATCPLEKLRDPDAAVESATRACQLSGWKVARYVATLAAAYSETGDFDNAVENQQKALALIAAKAPESLAYRRWLERYRAKKPHHTMTLLQELGIRKYDPDPQSSG